MKLTITPLTDPTPEMADAFSRWENDPDLVPLTRPSKSQEDLDRRHRVTIDDLRDRQTHHHCFLIWSDNRLVGEMNYQVDPRQLFRQETGTAWVGIMIGEPAARGKGIGVHAMQFLEARIRDAGLRRIELGVFEFNTRAIRLYQKVGYQEIGRIADFTYWEGRMWQDIRMEKRLGRS